MPRLLLDTNILIRHFNRTLSPSRDHTVDDARLAAQTLIEIKQTRAIVSPIAVEFLAGLRDPHEQKLGDAYLAEFEIVDRGEFLPDDWRLATRFARRIPPEGGTRQLGDCLILALAVRLRYDIDTVDRRLGRERGRNR